MSISGIGKSLEVSLFGSKRRVINTILTTVILFAVPITLQLTFQRQDVRQRASGVYPDGCPNNYTVNGATYSNACTNLQCSQLGMVPYQGANADIACQGTNWQTGQPYGQRCCTQPGNTQPPPSCSTGNACQVAGQVYGSADSHGYYRCDGHCWQWVDCPSTQTFNGLTCSASTTPVCTYGTCSGTQAYGSADAQGYYRCDGHCYQWTNCPTGQTYNTSIQNCATPQVSCPALRPDPVYITCSGNTVTCTWNSAVPNATSWSAQILSVSGSTTTPTCSSSSGTSTCMYGAAARTLTQTNVPNGSYKCGAAGVGAATCAGGPIGYSGVCLIQTAPTASCTDTQKNGNETDRDCGGGTCPACGPGKTCNTGADCQPNLACTGGFCTAPTTTTAPVTTSAPAAPTATGSQQPPAQLQPTPTPTATGAPAVPTPTPTLTPTATPTSAPGTGTATYALSISLPGIGTESYNNNSPRATRTVTVTLNQENGGQKIKDASGTVTYQNGKYTGSVSVPNIAPGSYYIRIRLDNTQFKKDVAKTIAIGNNSFTLVTPLVSGDLFETNSIGLQEYNAITNCFNGGECTAATRAKADLNDDGIIDAKDINILIVEFARGQITGDSL